MKTRQNPWLILGVGSALVFTVGVLSHYFFGYWWKETTAHAFGPDESFITYRYARNFANGLGLVWNPGERVEGYSAILHLFIAALGAKLVPENIYEFCITANLILVLITGFFYLKSCREKFGEWGWFPVLFVALNPTMWLWTASGFESPLVACLIFLIGYFSERIVKSGQRSDLINLNIVGVLAVLMHVDGFLNCFIGALFLYMNGSKKAARKLILTTVLIVGTQIIFRLYYYGYPMNNPYYLKMDGNYISRLFSGIRILWELICDSGWFVVLGGLLLSFIMSVRRFVSEKNWKVFEYYDLVFVLWTGYFIFIGGDYLYERMILSFVLMVPFALLRVIQVVSRNSKSVLLGFTTICGFLVFIFDGRFYYDVKKRDMWKELGLFLKKEHPTALIAVDAAGKIPYFSNLRVIDMLGYNETHIAHGSNHEFEVGHSKYDPEYVLSKQPDLICFWMDPELEGKWGLTEKMYRSHGYSFYLLVNSTRRGSLSLFIRAEQLPGITIDRLVRTDWRYVVLKRKGYKF